MAGAQYLDSPEDEDRVFAELEATRTRRATNRAAATPAVAARVTANKEQFPYMAPAVNLSVSKAGHGPESAVTKKAALGSAKAKSKKGLGWHSIGDVVKAGGRGIANTADFVTPEAVENVVGKVAGKAGNVGKLAARGAFLAGDALADEVAYNVRDTAQKIREKGVVKGLLTGGGPRMPGEKAQSDLAIIGEKLDKGERVDIGSGFFPAGEIAKEQAARAREFGTIDGHAITAGRLLASTLTEPGTRSYTVLSGLVDASIAIKADPAAGVLAASSKARAAKKLFVPTDAALVEAAGGVAGARKTTIAPSVAAWLDGEEGRKVTQFLAEEPDFQKAWEATNKKIPVKVLAQIADTDDPRRVRDILAPELGLTVREKPTVGGFGVSVRKSLSSVRLAQMMPGDHLDLDDIDQAVEHLDRWQRNAKFSAEAIAENNGRLARSSGRVESFRVVKDVMTQTAAKVAIDAGADPAMANKRARQMTRLFEDRHDELTRYFVDEIGDNARVPGVTLNGAGYELPTPHLFGEYINRTVPLPDARDIRRATSRYGRLLNKPGLDIPIAMADAFMSTAWKPLNLLRPAWVVRVIGEEQVRMGGAGMDSLVNHPLSAIAWAMGRKGAIGPSGANFADASAAADDLDDFAKAMSKGSAGWRGEGAKVITTKHKTIYRPGDERFGLSWAEEVLQLRADPIGSRVALGRLNDGDLTPNPAPGLDGIKDWFSNGAGREFRDAMAEDKPGLLDRVTADAYIDSVQRRIHVKAAGAPELIDAMATGKLGTIAIRDGGGRGVSKDFVAYLDDLAAKGLSPQAVKGDVVVSASRRADKARDAREGAVEWLFSVLMSKNTNYLSRSPAFRQSVWARTEELIPNMSTKAQAEVIANARKAKLDKDQIASLIAARAKGVGDLTVKEADDLAKGYALDATKKLLYDQTERQQWADVARLIFPFGSAWAEVGTRWAKIGTTRPQVIRRAQQTVEGARGAGIFYPDPQTGDERFGFFGSQFASSGLLGIPIPLEGSVAGLSFFGENVLMPGFGPVVQVPAGWLLPDKPAWDDVREFFLPYGEKDTSGGFLESFMPPWFQRVRTSLEDAESDRVLGNATSDVARYLASTGKYDLSSVEGQADLLEDAKDKGRGLFLFRAFAQFFAPSPPTPKFLAMDKDGRLTAAFKLTEEFHKLQDEDYETAVEKFIDRFGEDSLLFMVDKSKGKFPSSKEGSEWAREHPDLAKAYPNTYGFFAPQGGDPDYPAYLRQIRTGERDPTKPSEAVPQGTAMVGASMYRRAKAKLPPRPNAAQRQWLAEIRDEIAAEYPGFDPMPKDLGKTDRLVRELAGIVKDPAVADTDAGKGTALYLKARAKALDAAKGLELTSFAKAKKARHLRDWLRDIAADITEEHPEFAQIYERVLEREMTDDAEEAELAAS